TGKADNVVQKTQRSVETAVLIVDLGIDVAAIRGRDHAGNGLEVLFGPAAEFEAGHMRHTRLGVRSLPERQHHEQPGELLEAFPKKGPADIAGFVQKKLGFDALHARRALQGVDHVRRQAMLDALIRAGDGAVGEEIADHTLAALVNEESVAADSIVINRSVAG